MSKKIIGKKSGKYFRFFFSCLVAFSFPHLGHTNDKILFKDGFESTATIKNQTYTQPEVYLASEKIPGGRITGTAEIVDGKVGKALRLKGMSQILYYPVDGSIDVTGGELSFWVALNFDPMESNEKTRTVLRNQMFLTIWDMSKGHSKIVIYNAGKDTYAVCVTNAERNIVFYRNFKQVWKPNEWHYITLKWGKEMELWCDGEKKTSAPFEGLFGEVPVNLKETRIIIGSQIGWTNIESEFTIDELTIKGPGQDQISSRPKMVIPLLSEEPTLDGKLNDLFWSKSSLISGFVGFDKNEIVATQPVLYAAYTKKGLYFGLEATLPPGTSPRALLNQRDSSIYTEDAIEIFLQPVKDSSTFYQFIGSALGTRFDAKYTAGKVEISEYNPEWQIRTESQPGKWTAEIFIPFKALDYTNIPTPGEIWKVNFCLDSANGFSNAATWSFTNGNFCNPTYFGEILFAGKERALRQEKFSGFKEGDPLVSFSLIGDFQPIITISDKVFDSTGQNIYKNEMFFRDTKTIDFKPPFLATGSYTMVISGKDETGLQLFYQRFQFQTTKTFDINLENYPYAGYLEITANTKGVKDSVQKVICNIIDKDNKKIDSIDITKFKEGIGKIQFANQQLSPGTYLVEAQVIGKDGKILETAKKTFQIFEKPSWWNNNLGIDHSVPPPFQPVKVSQKGLSVWGRDYLFEKRAFPQQITSQNVSLFSQAPTFILKTKEGILNVGLIPGTTKETFPDIVSISGQQKVGPVSVECLTTVEFDGFLRCDLTVTPDQPTDVEELILWLHMPREIAKFLLISNGAGSTISVIDKEINSTFAPYLWIGNDDMGLAWFAETDQFWTPKGNKMLQVVPEEGEVSLKINMITKPVSIQKPIVLSFGLMATPVKQIPVNDPFAYQHFNEKTKVVTFSDYLIYPLANNLLSEEGTLEFFVKRSETRSDGNTGIFSIGNAKNKIICTLLTPEQPDTLVLSGKERLLTATVKITTNAFSHLAFTWKGDTLSCYLDGKIVGKVSGKQVDMFREAVAAENGVLRFGCHNDWWGYTGIVLDEVRTSKISRYSGDSFVVPQVPFQKDGDTLLLDHLDETFVPDGQDAKTKGGGIPTIGCSFVQGKFNQGLKIEVAPSQPTLEVLKNMGIRIATIWNWTLEPTPQGSSFYGMPYLFNPTVPGLKEKVEEYHRYGISVIPYMAYPAPSSTSGLIERYGSEWAIKPVRITPCTCSPGSPEGYHLLDCCLKARSYSDYFAAFTAWVMDTFGFDGFYSDGLARVHPCQNEAHGCGYRDENGNLHPTYPIFAVRDTLKRMYRIVKEKKPDGYVVNHLSFDLIIPILSFSDIIYTGEHEDYENLLTARVRFSSKPWGVYVVTLGSSKHIYSPLHEMTSLLHGTCVWGQGLIGRNDMARKDMAIRNVYKSFNTMTAVWVPYFKGEGNFYTQTDPKIKASFYYHPGKDVLLLIANYNPEEKEVHIHLNLSKLGLSGKKLTAVNALTQQMLNLSPDGLLTLKVNSKSFCLVRIE